MKTELHTARLTMRRARPEDLDALHALVSDFEVVRHTASWLWPADRSHSAKRRRPVDPALGMAGPVLRGGEIIGLMGLIAYVWPRYDWPEIHAAAFTGNPASIRVIEKPGFAEVARGEGSSRARGGGPLPLRRYRLPRP